MTRFLSDCDTLHLGFCDNYFNLMIGSLVLWYTTYDSNNSFHEMLLVFNRTKLFHDIFQVITLTAVSIGVAVATVTDLQFSLFGACVALAWIVPSAVNKILWSNLQQQESWTALAYVACLLNYSTVLNIVSSL